METDGPPAEPCPDREAFGFFGEPKVLASRRNPRNPIAAANLIRAIKFDIGWTSRRSIPRLRCRAPYFKSVPSSSKKPLLDSDRVEHEARSFEVLKILC